jgi:hypothetical protein
VRISNSTSLVEIDDLLTAPPRELNPAHLSPLVGIRVSFRSGVKREVPRVPRHHLQVSAVELSAQDIEGHGAPSLDLLTTYFDG